MKIKSKKYLSALLAAMIVVSLFTAMPMVVQAMAPFYGLSSVSWKKQPVNQTMTIYPGYEAWNRVVFNVEGSWKDGNGYSGSITDSSYYSKNVVPGKHEGRWQYRTPGSSVWKDCGPELNNVHYGTGSWTHTCAQIFVKPEFNGYAFSYAVRVWDDNGKPNDGYTHTPVTYRSAIAYLVVRSEPVVIVSEPPPMLDAFVGQNVSFEVEAKVEYGSNWTLSYQWYENNKKITNGGIYSGATSKKLTLSNVTTAQHCNYYYCDVTNKFGAANPANNITRLVLLSVKEKPRLEILLPIDRWILQLT
jgi:hypothetical protein